MINIFLFNYLERDYNGLCGFKQKLYIEEWKDIMKKFLAIMLSLVLLSGCSLFSDSVNVNELGKEMGKVVSKFNDNEQKYTKIASHETEIGSIFLSMDKTGLDQTKIKQVSEKQAEIRKLLTESKTELENVAKELPNLQKKVDKIKKEKLKNAADTFLTNFKLLIDSKQKVISGYEKFQTNQESIVKDAASNKEPSMTQMNDETKLQGELMTLQSESLQKLSMYNKSWQEFADTVNKK
ncbi:septal ring factor EnvC (AmiA/AmiB activator) [Croceifilum oryzae]|uniref:Septal ring factor EnvC (AmiA/AmiB activator) n=1 Tax=Croceifilum oryzae TaxID=1553429 RepID=A0AAJ1TE16_9BACL|nr:hypothetical protein [Croceifilum oryzae]MDQ0416774.1 septal ring factor EnvC (AmiA/AmiB activator) [Croceifilum oryzae]